MIIVKLQGGLGNQMFQYALGRSLSLKNKTLLVLDIGWFANSKNRKFSLENFNVEHNGFIKEKIFIKYKNSIWYHWRNKQREKVFSEKPSGFNEQVLGLSDYAYLDGYWQSEKYFKDIEGDIRKEFTLKNGFGTEAELWANKISNCEAVSVHIRRGDYLDPKHQSIIGVMPITYYQEATEIIKSKTKEPVFFIFSDDISWAKDNLKLPYQMEFISGKSISAPEEMILMSLCKNNITANSSFSWWGAWLNQNPNKIVVAPKNWFVDPKMKNDDLIPISWIQI